MALHKSCWHGDSVAPDYFHPPAVEMNGERRIVLEVTAFVAVEPNQHVSKAIAMTFVRNHEGDDWTLTFIKTPAKIAS